MTHAPHSEHTPKRRTRRTPKWFDIQCPFCGAPAGHCCVAYSWRKDRGSWAQRSEAHFARKQALRVLEIGGKGGAPS